MKVDDYNNTNGGHIILNRHDYYLLVFRYFSKINKKKMKNCAIDN